MGDRKTQRTECVAGLFAEKARLQHQRCSKQECQPKETRAEPPRFRRSRIKGKAEEHYDDQHKNGSSRQKLPRAKLRAKFLAEQHRRIGEQRHSRAPKRENRANVRAVSRFATPPSPIQLS